MKNFLSKVCENIGSFIKYFKISFTNAIQSNQLRMKRKKKYIRIRECKNIKYNNSYPVLRSLYLLVVGPVYN